MLNLLLLPVLTATPVAGLAPSVSVTVQEPQVQVWLNKSDRLHYGEDVRVYVRTAYDGHLVVLHADPEGRVRVIFPIDPFEDDFIRGGTAYEIKGRSDEEAFRTLDASGPGMVYAAYSPDPFVYAPFVLDDHWDFRALGEVDVTGDAEDELTGLVTGMSGNQPFVYDLADYYVVQPVTTLGRARYADDYYYDYDSGYRGYWGVGFSYGYGPYRHSHYTPFHHRWGLTVSFGPFYYGRYYDPWWYDPWYYDPWYYDPWYWGYSSYYYSPWRYRTRYYQPIVVAYTGPRISVSQRYTFRDHSRGEAVDYRNRVRTTFASASSGRQRPADRQILTAGNRRTTVGSATVSTGRRATTVTSTVTNGRRTVSTAATGGVARRTPATVSSGAATTRRTTGAAATTSSARRTPPAASVGTGEARRATPQVSRRSAATARASATRSSAVNTETNNVRRGSAVTMPSRTQVSPARRSATTANTPPLTTAGRRAIPASRSTATARVGTRSSAATSSAIRVPTRASTGSRAATSATRPTLERRSPVSGATRSSAGAASGTSTIRRPSSATRSSAVRRPASASSGSSSAVRRPPSSSSSSAARRPPASSSARSAPPPRRSGGSASASTGSSGSRGSSSSSSSSGRRRGGGGL